MSKSFKYGLAALMIGVASAEAAELRSAQGEVLVNTGSGFTKAISGQQLPPGTHVMTRAGGSAQIAYSGSCVTEVKPNSLSIVISKSPCEGRMNQGATNDGVGGVIDPTLVVGGALVAGGVAAAVILANDKKSPASP